MDAWLYETCTQCLQHMVDIVALFYKPVAPILPRIFDLLSNFIRCRPARIQEERQCRSCTGALGVDPKRRVPPSSENARTARAARVTQLSLADSV